VDHTEDRLDQSDVVVPAPRNGADTPSAEPSPDDAAPAGRAEPAPGTDGDRNAAAVVGEFALVDPGTLIIGVNYRKDAQLDKDFVADIADRGVREPIPVRRRKPDGKLVVRKGRRRTLGAIEAGRREVPVFIEPGPVPTEDDRDGQIDLIIDQLGENTHRRGHKDLEEVQAHQQLLDLGLSATAIAKRTHVPRRRVAKTTAVAASAVARGVMERHPDVSFEHLTVIAELGGIEGEAAEATKALTVAAKTQPGQFDHIAQQIRDQRASRKLHIEQAAELAESGVRVVNPDPDNTEPASRFGTSIRQLRPTASDPSGTALDEAAHASCPGHAVHLEVFRRYGRELIVEPTYLCTAPEAHGHTSRWDHSGSASTGRQPGPMTEEEKADRRRVVANNKAWDSATTVRLEWLTTFLRKPAPPKDAARFIATTLAGGSHDVRRAMESNHPLACELLGLGKAPAPYTGASNPIDAAVETAKPARLTMITLGLLLAALEGGTSRNSWRSPSGETKRYFTVLQAWGYPLAPVEQLVNTPDVDADTSSEGGAGEGGDTTVEDDVEGDVEGEPHDEVQTVPSD
jgi:ParB family chromosome partitioning protein